MKYTLCIDTSQMDVTVVAVIDEQGKRVEKQIASRFASSQTVLPAIEQLLLEQSISWANVKNVTVSTGPGSFTGLRVGASVAATLSWVLDLPLNGQPPGTIPSLNYGEDKWKSTAEH